MLDLEGFPPHAEDGWREFKLGEVSLRVERPCTRCSTVLVDQEAGKSDGAPISATGYLRGRNTMPSLDAVHVGGWEVAVAVAGGASTRWVQASRLKLTRGAQGAALWAAQQQGRSKRGRASKDEL